MFKLHFWQFCGVLKLPFLAIIWYCCQNWLFDIVNIQFGNNVTQALNCQKWQYYKYPILATFSTDTMLPKLATICVSCFLIYTCIIIVYRKKQSQYCQFWQQCDITAKNGTFGRQQNCQKWSLNIPAEYEYFTSFSLQCESSKLPMHCLEY